MIPTKSYAALNAKEPLSYFEFSRRDPTPKDVVIQISHCGICHSDIHQARNEWGDSIFPMVPGHEIIGTVTRVGAAVTKHKVGDTVGVGCFVDSCRTCPSCLAGDEQYCEEEPTLTYNGYERDGVTPTYGGYSTVIVVDEEFVLKIPPKLRPDRTAPLLCAGITTFSPLRHWKIGKGSKVGIIGLGGLGHMAVKLASAMGAEVTVFSRTAAKKSDAQRFGATDFVTTADKTWSRKRFDLDLILNTVSVNTDLEGYIKALKRDGTLVMLGVPEEALTIQPFNLILGRKRIGGSLVGGIAETQEMLNFCGEHGIESDIETIEMNDVNNAYTRMLKSDVRYRFVIDIEKFAR